MRYPLDAATPFEIASNDSFATDDERKAIGTWATLRESCNARFDDLYKPAGNTAPLQAVNFQQMDSFRREALGRESALLVSLYQQKLTFGEFAQKRYEIFRDAVAAQRQFRQS